METNKKVFVLQLFGDISMGSGVILEIGGVSHDRSVLETLKVTKDEELDEYLKEYEEGIDEDKEPDYSYYNNDLSGRPVWEIREVDFL